ncbi:hypothetical protein AWN66_21025 [Klebsiella pneumoniae subsp. pneumoniae]|nr:hypothetical protein AWN66_21025 [Klebsiella pneumoniae subsp. pneumoniae]
MFLASLYPKMELSGLHCDFAALSRFHRQCEHVYFDKAIYPFFLTNWKAAFTDHLAGVAEFVTGTAAELIQGNEWFRHHKIDARAH